MMKSKKRFHAASPTWCKGCGLFGVFDALKRSVSSLDLEPEKLVLVTGIGCHGRLNNYFRAYGFHGLHGRVLPVASGVKLANPSLTVVGISGDGDAYSIGLSHFVHSARRNIGITYLVIDNRIYALTQGQTSPTSDFGYVSVSTPFGSKEIPLDGPRIALASGATFIARGFSGDVSSLESLLIKAVKHKGFSLVEVLSPCITHNKVNTYEWYRGNTFYCDQEPGYNPGDKGQAWEVTTRKGRIPMGIIFEEEKASFEELVLPDLSRPIAMDDLSIEGPRLEKIMEKFLQ